jgi:GTP-binding protein
MLMPRGYGFATGNKRQTDYWPEMIRGYITGRPNLKMVYVLVDAERGVGPLDLEMLRWLRDTDVPTCLVVTKVDKLPPSKQKEARAETAAALGLAFDDIHWVSAKKTYGMNPFRLDVVKALGFRQ